MTFGGGEMTGGEMTMGRNDRNSREQCLNAAINVMPEEGGGPRDEVGTLNALAHPTWGILVNFEHKCWPRYREV